MITVRLKQRTTPPIWIPASWAQRSSASVRFCRTGRSYRDLIGQSSWDNYYGNDLDGNEDNDDEEVEATEPSELESWFSDVDAPARTLDFLTHLSFPLSPSALNIQSSKSGQPVKHPSILDLGSGNGSTLFQLRIEGGFEGCMLGVDYSPQSVALARKLARGYGERCRDIAFEVVDLIRDEVRSKGWWPGCFDLVLDKGTFDAVSLSDETVVAADGRERRICEVYPVKAIELVRPGGFLLMTSCNWTEAEVVRWFTTGERVGGRMEVWGKVKYPTFRFGGQEGQGVASVCFRRVDEVD